jgi:glycogen debranching enzyme
MMAVALIRPDILYAWKGRSLLIVNTQGQSGDDQALSGFYHREARFLRTLKLEINGEPPWLCEAAAVSRDALAFTYVYPEIERPGGGGTGHSDDKEHLNAHGVPERAVDIRLSCLVDIARLTLLLTITNRAGRPIELDVGWTFGADFADLQEAQAGCREQQAAIDVSDTADRIEIAYRHPQLPLRTEIRHGSRWRSKGAHLITHLSLPSQEPAELEVEIVPKTGTADFTDEERRGRNEALRRWQDGFAAVAVPGNRVFEQVLANNLRDMASLASLEGPPDEWLSLQAAMPLYPAFFGRDAVTAGWQAGYVDRGEALDSAMTKLGRLQSTRTSDWRDEEPGRIPYQVRTGPLALLDLNPYAAYYADYASPLMFVIALANLYAWTGDRSRLLAHRDTALRILDWARDFGDADGDGYLEYHTRSTKGTKNQGWKDSGDAIVNDDGSTVSAPIATCELQGYWYLAQQLMALLAWMSGERDEAAAYRKSAAALKERFNRDWWVPDEQCFALALDAGKRQVKAVTSNVGHCLACGIIDRERLPMVVGRLFAPDLFSGWGVRTLSTEHVLYNPLSYHRGSVWAVEQATLLFGLRRFGFDARAQDLAQALFDLAQLYPEHRIPECIGGYARGDQPLPGAYPRANAPQLWNATAFPLLVQSLLGLVPFAAADSLMLDPALPSWIPELVLSDLRVGGAKVTLRFWRDESGTSRWEVLHKQGTLHVFRQPPPESLSSGWTDRAAAAFETLFA